MRVQPKSLKVFFENQLTEFTMEHNLKIYIYITESLNCTPEKKNIVYFIVIIFVNCMLHILYITKIYNKYMYA